MARPNFERRLLDLEKELARLAEKVEGPKIPWWRKVAGTFADDPAFDEAMRLGREYRESLRPKQAKNGGAKKNGHIGHGSGYAPGPKKR